MGTGCDVPDAVCFDQASWSGLQPTWDAWGERVVHATFDAAVCTAAERDDPSAKPCYERAPDGRHIAFPVVTRGVSDDPNGWCADTSTLASPLTGVDRALAFRTSTDAFRWGDVRWLALRRCDGACTVSSIQAHACSGCTAAFEFVALREGAIANDDVCSGRCGRLRHGGREEPGSHRSRRARR